MATKRLNKNLRGIVDTLVTKIKALPVDNLTALTIAANGAQVSGETIRPYGIPTVEVVGHQHIMVEYGLATHVESTYGEGPLKNTYTISEFGLIVLGRLGYRMKKETPKAAADAQPSASRAN